MRCYVDRRKLEGKGFDFTILDSPYSYEIIYQVKDANRFYHFKGSANTLNDVIWFDIRIVDWSLPKIKWLIESDIPFTCVE